MFTDDSGRAILWDAQCGNRSFLATATDRLARTETVDGYQPEILAKEEAGPTSQLFSLPAQSSLPLSRVEKNGFWTRRDRYGRPVRGVRAFRGAEWGRRRRWSRHGDSNPL